jgi:O-antigen ligase
MTRTKLFELSSWHLRCFSSTEMAQKLQSVPQDRVIEAQWTKVLADANARGVWNLGLSISRFPYLAAAAAGLLILVLLTHPTGGEIIVAAIVVAAVLPYAIYYTSSHVNGLLIVLVLIEAVAASSFAGSSDAKIGAITRYPLNLLFVLPVIPALWKSGILRQGGFRDYGIYLLWALFSVSYSILPTVSLGRAFAAILPFLALCAIASEVRSEEDARRAMGVLLAGCGIVVAANYLEILIQPGTAWQLDPESGMERFVGFLTEPNEIGNLTMATVAAGYGYWPVAKGWKKGLAAIAMIGSLVQGVMADSRSPIIGMAIGCVVYLVLKYRAKGVFGAVALGLAFYVAIHAIPGMHEYLDRGDVSSFTGREVAWDFEVRAVKDSPLVGYGYEVEGQILASPYFQGWDAVWGMGYQTSLHNGYLSRAVSLGLPALVFWLFFMLRPMASCFLSNGDPWKLRWLVPLALLPMLILETTESVVDFRSFGGLMMGVVWTMLERERLFAHAQAAARATKAEESKTPIVRVLQRAHAS